MRDKENVMPEVNKIQSILSQMDKDEEFVITIPLAVVGEEADNGTEEVQA